HFQPQVRGAKCRGVAAGAGTQNHHVIFETMLARRRKTTCLPVAGCGLLRLAPCRILACRLVRLRVGCRSLVWRFSAGGWFLFGRGRISLSHYKLKYLVASRNMSVILYLDFRYVARRRRGCFPGGLGGSQGDQRLFLLHA